jgi:gluconate:H+ symporter, GntP family
MGPFALLLLGIMVVVAGILIFRLHAFFALILAALAVGALTPSEAIFQQGLSRNLSPEAAQALADQTAGERVAREFGATAGRIGLLIAMAALIGKCLLESGAADRIVRTGLRWMGADRSAQAFVLSGFLLAIPVFFDTIFLLLIPLGKAMAFRAGKNYALYVMSIIAGGTMAHSLVPPTPGPLYVAGQLQVEPGLMIVGGLAVGIVTSSFGYLYAVWTNARWPLQLRESSDMKLEEMERILRRPEDELPPLWMSLLPVLLPLALIGGRTVTGGLIGAGEGGLVGQFFARLGEPNIALVISAIVALGMVSWQRKSLRQSADFMQSALAAAGIIILITSAGGAFGSMLQQTGIGPWLQSLAAEYRVGVLPLAFGLTALVRTAQGSATVAMITTVGMLAGFSDPEQLGFHPLYLALAIGCGSKPFPWLNDSGFWVIGKMSGLTEVETIRYFSIMISLMGLAGLLVVMLAARLFPLI